MTPRLLVRALASAALSALAVLAGSRMAQAQPGDVCATGPAPIEIRRVKFEGNRRHADFSNARLLELVRTKPSSFARRFIRLFGTASQLNCARVAADARNLELLYRETGYQGTTVTPRITPATRGRVDVTFMIDEAQAILIDQVQVEWASPPATIDTAGLRHRLYSGPGRLFNRVLTTADQDTIERALRNNGYPVGVALYSDHLRAAERRAEVGFDIHPGPLIRFGEVRLEPIPQTAGARPAIRVESVRPLIGFRTGDLYSHRSLLDAQRRIYDLGTYAHVDVTETLRETDSVMTVTVRLLEDKMEQLEMEYGWATLDCFRLGVRYIDRAFRRTTQRVELSAQASKLGWGRPIATKFTQQNLCGGLFGGNELQKDSLGSSKINYNVTATLSQPGSFRGRITPSFSLYSERSSGYQAFLRETQIGGVATLSYVRPRLSAVTAYNLEYGHTDAEPAVLCFVFQACDESAREQLTGADRRLAVFSTRVTRERLDDAVFRSRGTLISADVRISNRYLGSDPTVTFNKGTIDASWYAPFPAHGGNVVVGRLRAGIIGGGARTGVDRLPPPQERLYAGGPNSVRGFQQNELGPVIYSIDQFTVDTVGTRVDTIPDPRPQRVIPAGGNSLLVGNLEYRIQDRFFPDRLEYVLFTDVGRVWTRGIEKQVGFRWTPGIGLRLFTLVGPIQVNLGYNGYDRPAGPAYLNRGLAGGGPAPLICISPKDPTSTSPCPPTYVPATPNTLRRRLQLTVSLGPS